MNVHYPSVLRAALGLAALAPSVFAQSLLSQGEVILTEGDAVPGMPGHTVGNGISAASATSGVTDSAVIDVNGNVFFRARIFGPSVTTNISDRVYFYGRTRETLQLVVRSGDPDPTGSLGAGTTLNTATGNGLTGSPRLSPEGGRLMFSVSLSGPSITTTNNTALLTGQAGALQVLARRGDSFTTASNSQTYQFNTAFSQSGQTSAINSLGVACFQATVLGGDVVGTTNNLGWLTGTPNNFDWVIRKNDIVTIPGGTNPGIFAMHSALGFNCMINLAGQVLHDERLLSAGTPPGAAVLATTANDNCVFVYTPGGGNAVLVREADPVAAVPGAFYGSPNLAQGFGLLGKCAFSTTMTGGVTTADDAAFFVGDTNSIQLAVREGSPAPGTGGATFSVMFTTFAYSDYAGGSCAFYSTLAGTANGVLDDSSVWVASPNGATPLQLIAREGDPAPGFANFPLFQSAQFGIAAGTNNMSPGSVWINNRGQVVFSNVAVTVTDTNAVATVFNSCVYCWDPTTGLKLLSSSNDSYPTVFGPQPVFTAAGNQFASGEDAPQSMNNDGDLVMRVGFTNGNGHGAIVRAKMGSMDCGPSALSATLGGVHTMKLDAGIANAGQIYVVIATASGTRPGFNFGGGHIPLNPDAVTSESINNLTFFPGTPWGQTLGILDANGRGTATFTMPPALPQFAGIDLDHAMAVIDLGLNVGFTSAPCGVLLY